jgi:hypothetical protein
VFARRERTLDERTHPPAEHVVDGEAYRGRLRDRESDSSTIADGIGVDGFESGGRRHGSMAF